MRSITLIGAAIFVLAPALALADCFNLNRIDQPGTTGWHTSLALDEVSDAPRIAYFDVSNGRLRFTRLEGISWLFETADENGGSSPSLQLDGNDVHISHLRIATNGLNSVKSEGAWNTEVVDAFDAGGGTSLALSSTGYPRIAYIASNPRDLKFASKSILGWSFSIVDTTGSTQDAELALDADDIPHIAYFDAQNNDLRYVRRSGTGVWLRQAVDTGGIVGSYLSMVLDASAVPHISYNNETTQQLKYARRAGVGWAIEVVADDVGAGANWSSIQLDEMNLPHIAYRDAANDDLVYVRKSGGMWIRCVADAAGDVGWYASLQLASSGLARISYCDYGAGDLKYATLAPTAVPAGGAARVALAVRPSVVGADGATIVVSQLAGLGDATTGGAGGEASLDLFDAAGRRVRSFAVGDASAGERALHWNGRADDGRALAQGVYFLRLATPDGAAATQRLTIVR